VLLDNMTSTTFAAPSIASPRGDSEASGRVTPQSAPAIAATGVISFPSAGLTHSAPILDVGLDLAC